MKRKRAVLVLLIPVLLIIVTALAQAPNRDSIFEPLTRLTLQDWQDETVLNAAYMRAQQADDMLAAASLLAATGWLNQTRQQPQQALSFFERAIETLHKTGLRNLNDRIIRDVLGQQGKGYRPQPRIPTDLEQWDPGYPPEFVRSENAAERMDAGLMLNIGVGYSVQSQHDIAERWWVESRKAAQKSGLLELERKALTNLAWLALQQKKSREATDYLNAAIKVGTSGAAALLPTEQLRHLWLLQGVKLRESGRLMEAIEALRTTVDLYQRAGDKELGRPLAQLATALALSGMLTEARDNYEKALALPSLDFETSWPAQCGVADIYKQSRDLRNAAGAYRKCVALIQQRGGTFGTDEGKVAFLGGFQNIYDSYLEVTYATSSETKDWPSLREAVESLRAPSTDALIDFRQRQPLGKPGLLAGSDLGLPPAGAGGQRAASLPNPAAQRAPALPNPVAQAAPALPNPVAQAAPALPNPVAQAAPALPNPVTQAAPALPNPRNLDNVAPPLARPNNAANERLIEQTVTFLGYYVLPQRTLIMVRKSDGSLHVASSAGRDRLRTLVQDYRKALGQETGRALQSTRNASLPTAGRRVDLDRAATALYDTLLRPVASLLPGPSQLLVIVPHDAIWEVPFEALPIGGGRFVVDQQLISYASSSRQWLSEAASPRIADHHSIRAWVIGNPRLENSISACEKPARLANLPGAEEEAKAIAAQLGNERADLFVGREADRMRLLAWHPNYSVIHIAAHGFTCPSNPNASGLVLTTLKPEEVTRADGKVQSVADPRLPVELSQSSPAKFGVSGILTAREIALRFRFQADLVFLSACQSGVGPISGEGVLGLSRAFAGAGARSLVLSVWLVGDDSARFLTNQFYAQYLMHGDKAVALREAVLATRKKFPRVEDWAAFRLIGPAT